MKKVFFVLVVFAISSISGYSQVRNELFAKNKFSASLSPTFWNKNFFGATIGGGYNIFNRTEIGASFGMMKLHQYNSFSASFYGRYYLLNRRLTPFIELNNTINKYPNINNSSDKYTIRNNPGIGLGLGYYGIAKHLGIEYTLYYFPTNSFGGNLAFKWYFK